MQTIPSYREALEAIANGEGDAQEIARQTLEMHEAQPGVGLLPPGYVAQRGGAALRLVPTRFRAPTLPNKCPSCGALPDVPCRWKSGRMGHRPEVHEKRLAAHKAT